MADVVDTFYLVTDTGVALSDLIHIYLHFARYQNVFRFKRLIRLSLLDKHIF